MDSLTLYIYIHNCKTMAMQYPSNFNLGPLFFVAFSASSECAVGSPEWRLLCQVELSAHNSSKCLYMEEHLVLLTLGLVVDLGKHIDIGLM